MVPPVPFRQSIIRIIPEDTCSSAGRPQWLPSGLYPDPIREPRQPFVLKERTFLPLHLSRSRIVPVFLPTIRTCKQRIMSFIRFWIILALTILPVIPVQWKPLIDAPGLCSVVLAQDTAAEGQPESESKPLPAADEQPVLDAESDSRAEPEKAPVADPEGRSQKMDPGDQKDSVEEPGVTAEPKDTQPVDSKEPTPGKPQKKTILWLGFRQGGG